MTLYMFVVIYGNEESQPACIFLCQTKEDGPTLEKRMGIFRFQNLKWKDIQVVMTDKDF